MSRPYSYPHVWDNTDDWVNEKEAQEYYSYEDYNPSKHIEPKMKKDEEIDYLEGEIRMFRADLADAEEKIEALKKENRKFRKIKRAHDIIKADPKKVFSVGVLKRCLRSK